MNSSDLFSFLLLASIVAVPIIAHKKGRRWWAWLIPTIFLGPFILVPVLIIKSHQKQAIQEEIKNSMSLDLKSSQNQVIISAPTNLASEIPKDSDGYVYVISNPSLPSNLVKIGFTKRDPSERLKELDQAGLPTEYVEHYRIHTANPRELEQRLHDHFDKKRLRDDKEFFSVTPQEVYEVLLKWGVAPLEL